MVSDEEAITDFVFDLIANVCPVVAVVLFVSNHGTGVKQSDIILAPDYAKIILLVNTILVIVDMLISLACVFMEGDDRNKIRRGDEARAIIFVLAGNAVVMLVLSTYGLTSLFENRITTEAALFIVGSILELGNLFRRYEASYHEDSKPSPPTTTSNAPSATIGATSVASHNLQVDKQ